MLTAATETHETRDQGSHRKHLWKENWDNSRHDERSVTSSLKAGKGLELTSRDTLQLAGAELTSPGDIRLKARDVAIGSASRSQSSSGNHYSGDLVGGSFFGRQGDADQGQTLHTGSRVNADGKLIVQADSVHVSASQVRGGTQASVISDSGALVIDGVQDTLRSNTHDKDSKFFSLINDERHQVRSDSNLVASDLHSDSNLELQSAGDITVSGSRVSANGQNTLAAKGDIHLVAGESSVQDDTRTHSRGFTAGAGETTPGSHEYRLAVGLKDQQQQRISDNRQQQGASVGGANLAVSAGGDLSVKGSDLAATAGDVRLSGQHIDLLAVHDTADSRTDTLVNAGGVVWTASLDKVSSGLEYQRQHQQDSRNQSTARPTGVTATHNVLLQAADALVNQGTQIEAGKQLRVEAGRVDNQAAHTIDSTSHSEQGWQAGLGVSAEIKGLSRPLEKVVKGLGQGKLPEGEWLKGVELAGVGLDGLVGYNAKQQTRQDSTALVSQLNAGAVQLNVRGALQDEGTRYRAGDGALNIKAVSHNAIAASDSHQSSEQGVEARLGLRVYTTTGEDVNLRANGAGKYQRAEETRSSAQVGRYAGSQGVSIQTRNDARYAGGEFDGGAGDVSLKAGGTLALNQATDSHSRSSSTLGATASLKLETAKDGGFTPGGELKPQIQFQSEQGSEARIASVQGQGRLQLAGATVDGEVLKGDEPQRLQAGIDQPIN
nr:hemagglutinin repeat-containing protein [Pseudomonas fragi]